MELTTITRLVRHPRAKCAHCGKRRVLFALEVTPTEGNAWTGLIESPRLCATDAGIGR